MKTNHICARGPAPVLTLAKLKQTLADLDALSNQADRCPDFIIEDQFGGFLQTCRRLYPPKNIIGRSAAIPSWCQIRRPPGWSGRPILRPHKSPGARTSSSLRTKNGRRSCCSCSPISSPLYCARACAPPRRKDFPAGWLFLPGVVMARLTTTSSVRAAAASPASGVRASISNI